MDFIPNILFAIALVLGIGFFAKNVKKLIRNIKLGKDVDVSNNAWPKKEVKDEFEEFKESSQD